MPDAAFFLRIAPLVGAGLAAVRLYKDSLYRHYPTLFYYLVFRVISGVVPFFLIPSSQEYLKFYICTQPVIWIFYILMVGEVYSLALASHKGVQTLGRWAMYIAVTASVALSLLSILKKITPKTPQISRYLGYVFAIDRGVNFALVIFILLILFFLSRYPVALSRNVVRHSSLLFVYFLSQTTLILLRSIYGRPVSAEIDLVLSLIATLVIFAWLFLITPTGEQVRKIVGIAPEHETRILQQLDALNATLLKISRN